MKTAGVFILTEIPEISVGSQMNRSNRNLPFHFWETGSFAVLIFTNTLYEISEKEWSRIPPGWAGLIKEKKNVILFSSGIAIGFSPVGKQLAFCKYHLRTLCLFFLFLAEIFRDSRPAARGSQNGLSLPWNTMFITTVYVISINLLSFSLG